MAGWSDKVVVVTGGSSGIGLATAREFARRGAQVVLAARGQAQLDEVVGQMAGEGLRGHALRCDVTSDEDVAQLITTVGEKFGRLDVLVNNAGRSMRKPILETTPDDFRDLMDLNFLAVVRCTRAAVPWLEKVQGSIVNVSSLAGKSVTYFLGAYPATKFALNAYSQQLRLELRDRGVHVLSVCPGPVATPILDKALHVAGDGIPTEYRKPGAGLKTRTLRPEEVAVAIVDGCENKRGELIFPGWGRFLLMVMALSSRLAAFISRNLTGR